MSIHISKHKDGWQVKHAKGKKAVEVFDTQEEAIKRGQQLANNQKEDLVVHGRSGKFRKK
jgi:uncharacterized protein YdaT